jgi:hypothetical protein
MMRYNSPMNRWIRFRYLLLIILILCGLGAALYELLS